MPLKKGRRPRRKVRRIGKNRRQVSISRAEFNQLIDTLNGRGRLLNQLVQDQAIQFQRIAQIQAELDLIKTALRKMES
jgi:hypothetical protein